MLRPEQQRAMDYVRRRGTEAPLAAIRMRVVATYEALAVLVGEIPADAAREHRPTSVWSIQEVVDHLVESDRPAVGQLSSLLGGRSVDEPVAASIQSARPLDHDWVALKLELGAIHRDLVRLLDGASDAIPQTATAPVQMVVKCAGPDGALAPVTWLERFEWKALALLLHVHNREHIAQIERILGR